MLLITGTNLRESQQAQKLAQSVFVTVGQRRAYILTTAANGNPATEDEIIALANAVRR